MNRINFIHSYINNDNFHKEQHITIVNSLVACLPAEEACDNVNPMLPTTDILQHALLLHIKRDIDTHGYQKHHENLILSLISQFKELPYNRKKSCGYWFSVLYPYLPFNTQENIIKILATSQYKDIRRRAYKFLNENWDDHYEYLITEIWNKYKDSQCAEIIVENFSISFILEYFSELENVLTKAKRNIKLFLKVGKESPELLNNIKKYDEITYVYVLVKLGEKLSENLAIDIFKRQKKDDRIGLLLWCYGQMKLWTVLKNIVDLINGKI
jgi:hypothetical protein